MKPIIVLGSGLAAYTLVRELRKLNRDTPVTLVTRDSGDYYSKPTLSNAFAQGKEPAGLVLTSAQTMAEQQGFTLLANTEVGAIHREARQLETTAGMLEYDKLVLAIGADPIRIPLQGDAADAVLSVNDLADYAIFRNALGDAKSVALMGGGLIGCEFANDLALAGFKVAVIDPGSYPLAGLLSEQAGRKLLEPLSKIGVTWRFKTAVQRVDTSDKGYKLTLTDQSTEYADIVLSAVGLRPRIQLAKDAGLAVNRGISVNARAACMMGNTYGRVCPPISAQSPSAKIAASELCSCSSTRMPRLTASPASFANWMRGRRPTAESTMSAYSVL